MSMPTNAIKPPASETTTVVGIDLGTSKSTVSYVDADGRIVMLCGLDNRPALVPTAVCFGESVLVGDPAVAQGVGSPDLYAEGFKREMGQPHFHRKIRQRNVPPEILCAFVLRQLKMLTQRVLGPIERAVITVPAYYNESRRKATQEAGRLAGLDVIDIINEPTAAAVAWAYLSRSASAGSEHPPRTTLVYDLGGGTFDVSVLRVEGRKFSTLATDGDIQLGGRDFDEKLANELARRFVAKHGLDPRGDLAGMHQLSQVARSTKHELTRSNRATAVCTYNGLRLGVEVTRADFEELIEPLVERTLITCVDVLQDARLDWQQIDEVLLVGGSSVVPLVAQRLEKLCGKKPILPESPELLVAQGAGLHAALRSQPGRLDEKSRFDIVNVNAHSLGVRGLDLETREPINTILIPRNTPLPATREKRFMTSRDDQANVAVNILEGESENPKFCTPIGKCVVLLERNLPTGTEVQVSCTYQANGLIHLAARIPRTKTSANVELRRENADQLEPLSVWDARLTLDQEPLAVDRAAVVLPEPSDQAVDASATAEQLLERLDYLYSQIGKRAAFMAVPPAVLAVKRMFETAMRDAAGIQQMLLNIESASAHASNPGERRNLGVLAARANSQLNQTISLAAHAQLVLGRACVDAALWPPECEKFRDETQGIRERVASAI